MVARWKMNRKTLMHLQHNYIVSMEWKMLKLLNLSKQIKWAPLNSRSFSKISTLQYLEYFKALVTLKRKGKNWPALCGRNLYSLQVLVTSLVLLRSKKLLLRINVVTLTFRLLSVVNYVRQICNHAYQYTHVGHFQAVIIKNINP